jgi:mRNA export factor
VTGSWDKTLKYWDARQPTPTLQVQLPERCYALSCTHPLLVVGCAERHLQIFNLSNPQTPYRSIQSPLKYQTRCVATFPDKSGYLIGSIEGRVAVNHVEDSLASKNFTFKCHREQADIYAVNSISFHPRHGTFVTTGSDGVFNFWDKDSKQRLKQMQKCNAPIPCGAFNRDGSIFAYAVSYDWSTGGQDPMASAQGGNNIFLHATEETEVKPRPPANRVGGRR